MKLNISIAAYFPVLSPRNNHDFETSEFENSEVSSNIEIPSKPSKRSRRRRENYIACHQCGRWCNSKSSLLTHTRVHTGEKPFSCDICGKTFSQKATLVRHRLLHSGEKNIKCNICYKRFYRKDKLTEHVVNVHKLKYDWNVI